MIQRGQGAGEWYDGGLRFQCTQCGNCCTGPTGFVWFSDEEANGLARKLGISVADFYHDYARTIHGQWSLNERKTEHGHDCIFLDRTSLPGKAICGVYEARPSQCRTWPFWPENLQSPRAWQTVKRVTPCPGMDTGKLIPIDQIRIQRDGTKL